MAKIIFILTHHRKITCPRCAGRGNMIGCMGTDFGTCTRCAGSCTIRV